MRSRIFECDLPYNFGNLFERFDAVVRRFLFMLRLPFRTEATWKIDSDKTSFLGRSDIPVELIADNDRWETRGVEARQPTECVCVLRSLEDLWPAPGTTDTELGVFMGPEVSHGETEVYTRVQA
jgi:hypothetical protein